MILIVTWFHCTLYSYSFLYVKVSETSIGTSTTTRSEPTARRIDLPDSKTYLQMPAATNGKESTSKLTPMSITMDPPTSLVPLNCIDEDENCPNWASSGHCAGQSAAYMKTYCKLSCNYCTSEYWYCCVWWSSNLDFQLDTKCYKYPVASQKRSF